MIGEKRHPFIEARRKETRRIFQAAQKEKMKDKSRPQPFER
jgi:hypothetical protein